MNSILEQIAEICKTFPKIEKAALFGSRARGDHKERSDYDIAVWTLENVRPTAFLQDISEKVKTLHKIDVVFISEKLKPEFLQNIQKEAVFFYEKHQQ